MRRLLIVIALLAPLSVADAKPKSALPPPPEVKGDHILYTQLSVVRWRIGMKGAGAPDPAAITHAIRRKAAKLTLDYGFDWFEAIGERAEPVESIDAVDPRRPLSGRPGQDLMLKWGRACAAGWQFNADPQAICPSEATPDHAYQATTQILMGHGLAPRNGLAVGARAVLKDKTPA